MESARDLHRPVVSARKKTLPEERGTNKMTFWNWEELARKRNASDLSQLFPDEIRGYAWPGSCP